MEDRKEKERSTSEAIERTANDVRRAVADGGGKDMGANKSRDYVRDIIVKQETRKERDKKG